MKLAGTERTSIEIDAVVDVATTDALARTIPSPLAIARDDAGRGHASVLALEMHGLGAMVGGAKLLPRFDYREVLYRIGVTIDDVPSWLAIRCDIDRPVVLEMARHVIRYPVMRARIDLADADGGVTLVAKTERSTLAIALEREGAEEIAPIPPRRTFVVDGGRVFEVPWDERPAPSRIAARLLVRDASACKDVYGGSVAFGARAVVHRGRTHLCGAAVPVA